MFKRRLRQSPEKLRGLDRPSFRARADRRGRDDEGDNGADFFPRPGRPPSARSVFPLLGRPRAKSEDHPTIASRRDPLPALNAAAVQAEGLYRRLELTGRRDAPGRLGQKSLRRSVFFHDRRARFFHAREARPFPPGKEGSARKSALSHLTFLRQSSPAGTTGIFPLRLLPD